MPGLVTLVYGYPFGRVARKPLTDRRQVGCLSVRSSVVSLQPVPIGGGSDFARSDLVLLGSVSGVCLRELLGYIRYILAREIYDDFMGPDLGRM